MADLTNIPILHIIKETVNKVKEKYQDISRIGLLATNEIIKTKIFQKELDKISVETILPNEYIMKNYVIKAINNVEIKKTDSRTTNILKRAAHHLTDQGADLIMLGCTELPVVFEQKNFDFPVIDPMKVLAKKSIGYVRKIFDKVVPKKSLFYFILSFNLKFYDENS